MAYATCLFSHDAAHIVLFLLQIIELVFKSFPTEGPEVFRIKLPAFLQTVLSKDVSECYQYEHFDVHN